MQWQAFKYVGNQTTIYTDGDYVLTQGGTNGVLRVGRSGTSATPTPPNAALTQFNAIQDQYMVEIGAAHPAPRIRGLTLTLGVRDEGVPARNLIGNDLGFRRPGFGIALEPGFIYNRGPHMFQVSVGRAIFRDRTLSVPDKILGGHGDAAFANYIWLAGYTLRLPKRHGEEEAAALNARGANGGQAAKFRPFNLRTLDGTKKTLQVYTNKVTLVAFFFPRCPFCNLELPFEQQMYDKYKDKGLSMVWINILSEEEKLIAAWQADRHFNVPVLIGASEDLLERNYHVPATPTNYLLGENGEVLYFATGYKAGDERTLEAKIVSALNLAQ